MGRLQRAIEAPGRRSSRVAQGPICLGPASNVCPDGLHVLLCAYHHHLIHHSGWQIHTADGMPWFTPPTYIDPHRRPRHNRPWQLDEQAVA